MMILLISLMVGGCTNKDVEKTGTVNSNDIEILNEPGQLSQKDTIEVIHLPEDESLLENQLINAGLVNIQELDPSILVDLKYAGKDNFMGIDLYGPLKNCFLQKKPALMLVMAQQFLKALRPDLTLLVYDGVRPLHIQQKMWDTLDMPPLKKKQYVSDPKTGSIHNYGAAVDLTLAYSDGTPLDMGTPYDYFGELAQPIKEEEMLAKGLLDEQQLANRKLLRQVMEKAGFTPIKYEWWHFNATSRARAKELYKIIE